MAATRKVSVQELADALASSKPPVVVDVRSGGEFASGHIEGILNVPLQGLPRGLPEPSAGPVWVICRTGGRSYMAAKGLVGAGYEVTDVEGGMLAWRAAGLPVTAPEAVFPMMPLAAALTLGLAPFFPEPHLVEKVRWLLSGAAGMAPLDFFDLLFHGAPWAWLARDTMLWLKARQE